MEVGERIIFETAAGDFAGTIKEVGGDLAMVMVESQEYVRLADSRLVKIRQGEQAFYVPRHRIIADQYGVIPD